MRRGRFRACTGRCRGFRPESAGCAQRIVRDVSVVASREICGRAEHLQGPAAPPPGAIIVQPGDSLQAVTDLHPPGSTFWLAPGRHVPGAGGVVPKDNDTYVGGPGAVVDGGGVVGIAFWEDYYGRRASGVTLRALTIQNFTSNGQDQGAVYAGTHWVLDRVTLRRNGYVALFLGPHSRVTESCFEDNGQLAIGTYRFADDSEDLVIDGSEFRGNNLRRLTGCGCGGAVKVWETRHVRFTRNWVHGNHGVGVWVDTNVIEVLLDGNDISDNDDHGVMYEISYNFMITNNVFRRNALVAGRRASHDGFPVAAVYISESGGVDVPEYTYAHSRISHNLFEDNWDGVVLWQSGNRYRHSDEYSPDPAFGSSFRWRTQNVEVSDNTFRMHRAAVRCAPQDLCGRNGLFSDWVPVPGGPNGEPNAAHTEYQVSVTFLQHNRFTRNHYEGPWAFVGYDTWRATTREFWQAPAPARPSDFDIYAPGNYGFAQDSASTFDLQP